MIELENPHPSETEPGRNGQILRKAQPSESEPGRSINYKQTNHNHWNWDCD